MYLLEHAPDAQLYEVRPAVPDVSGQYMPAIVAAHDSAIGMLEAVGFSAGT